MWFDQVVKIGELMDVQVGEVCARTKLQDIQANRRFVIFHPTVKGIPMLLEKGTTVKVSFYRFNGVYTFEAVVTRWYMQNDIKLCELEAVTEVTKLQRRKSYRLPIVMNVVLQRLDGDEEEQKKRYKAKTVDISEHGMLLTCFHQFEPGTPLLAHISLPDTGRREFKTQVLRCEMPIDNKNPHNVVLLFLDCKEHDRAFLRRFILKQQIIARKKKGPGS